MNSGSLKPHLAKDQISNHVQKEQFSVLKYHRNILNFYLYSAKTVCTQLRSIANLTELFTEKSRHYT